MNKLLNFIVVGILLLANAPLAKASPVPVSKPFTVSPERIKELAAQSQWLRLVHYKKNLWDEYRSEVPDPKFFLSPDGAKDPEKELAATITAMTAIPTSKTTGDKNPQCVFPARYRWLKSQLRLESFEVPASFCPNYHQFADMMDAHSVTLIFSSYFLGNPASVFGHTMLRLNKADVAVPGKKYELLDYGINYSAEVTTQNSLLYAIYGVFGLFRGTFTRVPYFYKVREYNDFESRDLWEYDLNLKPAQVAMLVDHIWELGATSFDYYYLTRNCSYEILVVLEVALPDVELVKDLPLIVIPADTIKALKRVPDLVARVNFRPSLLAQFRKRIEPLSSTQVSAVLKLASNEDLSVLPSEFSPEQKAQVLDAAMDHFDLQNFKTLLNNPEDPVGAWKQKMFVARSQIPVASDDLQIETPVDQRPDASHEVSRVGIESGYASNVGNFTSINFRYAMHDLLDPSPGYPKNAQVEFLNTKLRFNVDQKVVWLDDLTLFRATSLIPADFFRQPMSWRFRLGAKTVHDDSCDHCLAVGFEVGAGLAYQPFDKFPLLTYLTSDAEVSGTPKYTRSFVKIAVGPSVGARVAFLNNLAALFEVGFRYQFLAPTPTYFSYSGELRWGVAQDFALNLRSYKYPDSWENSLGLYYYF